MIMRNILILVCFGLLFSCKNDNQAGDAKPINKILKTDMSTPTDPAKLTIPSACEMITQEKLQAIMNTAGISVRIKEANDPANPKSKSCFFQWEDPNTPNAGILIQIQTNPVFEDYPQYISNFVAAKLSEGETVLGQDKAIKYKKFAVGETVGAFSHEQSRFYWSLGNDYLFMLALNLTSLNESKMLSIGEKIVTEINNNFATKAAK